MIKAGAFAINLCNFTDSSVPQPFTRTAAIDGWHTVENYWSYTSYSIASDEMNAHLVRFQWKNLDVQMTSS